MSRVLSLVLVCTVAISGCCGAGDGGSSADGGDAGVGAADGAVGDTGAGAADAAVDGSGASALDVTVGDVGGGAADGTTGRDDGGGGAPDGTVDGGGAAREANSAPLGAMYFFPFWPHHRLSQDCAASTDAPCAYAALGLPSIKLEDIRWKNIEPNAPVGGVHTYNWSTLDAAVLRWEEVGVRHLQFHITPDSPWAMPDSRAIAEGVFGLPCAELGGKCDGLPTNPRPEHWADWRAYVTALCERYDGDGIDDLEGLQHQHLEFELLNEGQNLFFYVGTSEDFELLLRNTREALDACNEAAEIIHYGVTFNGLSHGGVSDEVFWQRFEEKAAQLDPQIPGPGFRHAINMMLGSQDPAAAHDVKPTLAMCEHFEQVSLHCNWNIEHMIEEYTFVRDTLDAFGCESVRVICGDSTSGPSLYSTFDLEWWDATYGGPDDSGEALHKALGAPFPGYNAWCDPGGSLPAAALPYAEARAWYYRHHAAYAVKKAATALALGMTRFMAGLLEDWPPPSGCYWMYQGLCESEGGVLVPVEFGDPKPAYYSYGLLEEMVTGYESAARAVIDDVTILTFTRRAPGGALQPVYLVWYLDDHLPAPGEAERTRAFELQVGTPSVRVTHLITEVGVDAPVSEVIATPGGVYSADAVQTPVFIEPL